jgi:general L-amino acid transport system permease protein
VLLALGRASSYPAIKVVCTAWIEFVRGAPLVAWLFFGWFVLPHFLPGVLGLNDADLIVRVMIILALFTGAYIAEIVRGGLQSVPRGQVEAAGALGMGTFNVTLFIVLPQALRAVIPALVSQFITLWKDTTLVSILPVIEALSAGEVALAQSEFFGRQQEVLLFIAFLFWVVAMGMSRLSYRLERNLGIGTR